MAKPIHFTFNCPRRPAFDCEVVTTTDPAEVTCKFCIRELAQQIKRAA